jgi:CRISPR/Cas system-associated endonuclease Cas1
MPSQNSATVADLFHRDPADRRVAVADGYGLTIRVHRGHLLVDDGIGQHRRTRRYSRAERKLRRLVIVGDTGYLSLEAIRWCADVGIAIVQLDRDHRLLTMAGKPGRDDARLRRAQAAAPFGDVGVDIAKTLLGAKLQGQAEVASH